MILGRAAGEPDLSLFFLWDDKFSWICDTNFAKSLIYPNSATVFFLSEKIKKRTYCPISNLLTTKQAKGGPLRGNVSRRRAGLGTHPAGGVELEGEDWLVSV